MVIQRIMLMKRIRGAAGCALLSLLTVQSLPAVEDRAEQAENVSSWNQFRGGTANGYLPTATIPSSWSAEDYRWVCDLPGSGVGSAVAYADSAYLLCASPEKERRYVVAVNLQTGKILWQQEFPLQVHGIHARSSYASSTPYVDQSGVYVAWGDPEQVTLAALNHQGRIRWQRDLGRWQSQHGFGASPVMLAGKLVLFNSQQADQLEPGETAGVSRMMAFEPTTGETLWETPLTTTRACYGVPVLRKAADGTEEIIGANTGDGIFALNAQTGGLRWRLPVFNARCVSSPLVVDQRIIGSAGAGNGGNHLVAVTAPEVGDAQAVPSEVYRMEKNAPYVPTPAVVDKKLLMVSDNGIASAVDSQTGEVEWTKRISGNYGASPIVLGNKMLAISLDGMAYVIDVSNDKPELSGPIDLGGPVQATPSCCPGGVLLRVGQRLCCLNTIPR